MIDNVFFHTCLLIAIVMLSLAMLLTFLRLSLGPRVSHRVVALDLLANVAIGLIGLFSIWRKNTIYLDVMISLALVVFLGTVAYAQYIESRADQTSGGE